jgi:hypothetical protein
LFPGRAVGVASRPSRDSPWGSRLSRSLRGMPWLGANGLLPGRGAPGRGPGRVASAPPSRATGASVAPALAAAVVGTAVSGTSANGRVTGLGPGVGAPGREGASGALTTAAAGAWTDGAAGASGAVTAVAVTAEAAAAPGLAADFLAVDAAPALAPASGPPAEVRCAGNVSRILRTTGGSMVEEADRTNSPCSFKWLSNILLSTPSSFASS